MKTKNVIGCELYHKILLGSPDLDYGKAKELYEFVLELIGKIKTVGEGLACKKGKIQIPMERVEEYVINRIQDFKRKEEAQTFLTNLKNLLGYK